MSTKYLLDTTVCVSLLRGKPNLAETIFNKGIENCFISDITLAELTYGAVKSQNPKHFDDISRIQSLFKILSSNQCYKEYAETRYSLNRKGMTVMDFDLLIAATAIHNRLVMVTHNTKHFKQIDSLKIEDWE